MVLLCELTSKKRIVSILQLPINLPIGQIIIVTIASLTNFSVATTEFKCSSPVVITHYHWPVCLFPSAMTKKSWKVLRPGHKRVFSFSVEQDWDSSLLLNSGGVFKWVVVQLLQAVFIRACNLSYLWKWSSVTERMALLFGLDSCILLLWSTSKNFWYSSSDGLLSWKQEPWTWQGSCLWEKLMLQIFAYWQSPYLAWHKYRASGCKLAHSW